MMIEKVKWSVRCAVVGALLPGVQPCVASAQERQEAGQDIENVQFIFHLVEANGYADEDPEISDVVTELRKLLNFEGYRLLSTSVLNIGLQPAARTSSNLEGAGSQRIVADDSETSLTIMVEVNAFRAAKTVRAKVTLVNTTSRVTTLSSGAMVLGSLPAPLLEASATMRDGQRVLLGSSTEKPVLILVVTPRFNPQ